MFETPAFADCERTKVNRPSADAAAGLGTAAMLAESIGVSRRTVLRELPSVEQWIAAAGYRFVRSPGTGTAADEPPARRGANARAAERQHSLRGAAAPSAAAKAARYAAAGA